ncbi:MAG: hypothetical protein QF415_15000 [Candidatus Undinarchaeales archaeon]|nr:hypothetical protein [Candidatus Undinarchaeales archaeon]MDP7491498.1 hypothetical protein [Candidatus Undinarchaeales archaeon]
MTEMADASPKGFETEYAAWNGSQERVLSILDEVKESAKAGGLQPPTLEELGLHPSIMPELSDTMVSSITDKDVRDAYLFSIALARKFTINFWNGQGYPFKEGCEQHAERFIWLKDSLSRRPPVVAWADTLQSFVSSCLEFFDGINAMPEFERKDDLLFSWGVSYAYISLFDVALNVKCRYYDCEIDGAGKDQPKLLLSTGDVFLEDGDPVKAAEYMLQAWRNGDKSIKDQVNKRIKHVKEIDPDVAATLAGLIKK